jgi:HAD superfamily hydrolase (TIGR01549 family)
MPRQFENVRAVLFDWDGTLLNSYQADQQAYLAMFRTLGIPWGVEDLERHYSPDWYRIYRAARLPRAHWRRADRVWRLHYARQRAALLPEAKTVLRSLGRQFRLGLVTSGSRTRVLRQLRGFGLVRLFATRIYGESAEHRKPHPAPLELALRRLRICPEDAVYVGDAPEDILMAQRAGVRAVAVLGPFPTHERLRAARPDILLESIGLLPDMFA